MKQIAGYIADYFRSVHKINLVIISLIVSILIVANYHYRLNNFLLSDPSFIIKLCRFYLLFGSIFIGSWVLGFLISRKTFPLSRSFYLLLFLSPAVFAIKVSLLVRNVIPVDSNYLNTVLQWPLKALATVAASCLLWFLTGNRKPVAGLTLKNFNVRPYVTLLILMLPLLLIAGHRMDFQSVYPKLQMIREHLSWHQKAFFELCYGLDFFTIELFFRGFLILTFIKYAGRDAILPMAAFYCTIHFGKPLAECISSYFGGLILGAVVYNTRSIWGGLIVHLGIAWMMEVIGSVF